MDIRLRLIHGSVPNGEIEALDLGRICSALHEISIRLGRQQVEVVGPGRSKRTVEEMGQVRFRGASEGSTVLDFAVGPPDTLPLELEQVTWRDRHFEEILIGMADDRRPDGVDDLVADGVASLVQGIRAAAPEAELVVGDRESKRFVTTRIRRETWTSAVRSRGEDSVVFVGLLEKVDLYSNAFRVRDAGGNTVDVHDSPDPLSWAHLIGQTVRAEGKSVQGRSGQVVGLADATIEPHRPPPGVVVGGLAPVPIHEILTSAPGPDPDAGIDLTDDEFETFLKALGRG